MSKITKKEINSRTRTKKGQGFNPSYAFNTRLKSLDFEKPMGDVNVFVLTPDDVTGDACYERIGDADNKKEYIQLIYNYLNR